VRSHHRNTIGTSPHCENNNKNPRPAMSEDSFFKLSGTRYASDYPSVSRRNALVHLRRSIPTRNNDRLLSIFLPAADISLIISMSQLLQPPTNSFQILNSNMAGDIIHLCMSAFSNLSQRKMRGEFCLTVNTYFCHTIFIQNYHFQRCYGVTALRRQRMTLPVFLNTALVVPFSNWQTTRSWRWRGWR